MSPNYFLKVNFEGSGQCQVGNKNKRIREINDEIVPCEIILGILDMSSFEGVSNYSNQKFKTLCTITLLTNLFSLSAETRVFSGIK